MKYRVMLSVNISPTDENYSYNNLNFSRQFTLEGANFASIASQVDFMYDTLADAEKHAVQKSANQEGD